MSLASPDGKDAWTRGPQRACLHRQILRIDQSCQRPVKCNNIRGCIHTFCVIMKQSSLCLQEGRVGKDAPDLINFIVDAIVRLEEFLAAVYVKHECHDVLRKMFSDACEL